MSHFTTIKTEIQDVEALREACEELGLRVEENTQARGYSGNTLEGDYVVRLKGPYDVAVQKHEQGGYALVADYWNGHVEKEVGTKCTRLIQLYGVHKTTREARKRGCRVRRRNTRTGAIRLSITGGGV